MELVLLVNLLLDVGLCVSHSGIAPNPSLLNTDRSISVVPNISNLFGKVVFPDTSRMVIYDPRQKPGMSYLSSYSIWCYFIGYNIMY